MVVFIFQEPLGLEPRRGSKYEIYGSATKPFGESYRKSLAFQPSQEHDKADNVEDNMGCSESKSGVAHSVNTVQGSFKAEEKVTSAIVHQESQPSHLQVQRKSYVKNTGNVTGAANKLSDFEIIYGYEKPKETTYSTTPSTTLSTENDGYSTIDIYSEVKKPDKGNNTVKTSENSTPREMLMQQIRSRREDNDELKKEDERKAENEIKPEKKLVNRSDKEEENGFVRTKDVEENNNGAVLKGDPGSFVEEEYSYEPDKKEATSKLVVRSRSLVNLDHVPLNQGNVTAVKRPNAMKITTKPDGTIRYGLRQELSDSDLLDNDSDDSPPESEIKNNYVSSLKNAFDAAIVEHQAKQKLDKAEAFDGLRQYFQDNKHGLQELLINNNVVIIEPFRHDPPSSSGSDGNAQRTCRITGATIKSPVSEQNKILTSSNTLPRRSTKPCQNARPGFYHPIKTNKELKDDELPDPEKVKSAREWFEQIFKSKSSSEIPSKKSTTSFFNTISSKMRITPEVKVIQEGKQTNSDKKRQGRLIIDQSMKEEFRRHPHKRWTDSGSLSSGVSSDFSCDQDCELHHHDGSFSGSNQEILEEYSTEDEDAEYFYPYDVDERHPVSSEVLQKIRACGTTVTYYGGKVISRSHGQVRSPMTMTIMDEIRQCGTTEGIKKFEPDHEEPYLGVKFRLVKSNSCGSRLEIAGTEEDCNTKLLSPRHESFRGETIAEETIDMKEEPTRNDDDGTELNTEEEDGPTSLEEEEHKTEADRYVTNVEVTSAKNPQVMTWAELKLKEARKQWHCAPEAVRLPAQDMEFETFEVLDESKPHKADKTETGRG